MNFKLDKLAHKSNLFKEFGYTGHSVYLWNTKKPKSHLFVNQTKLASLILEKNWHCDTLW